MGWVLDSGSISRNPALRASMRLRGGARLPYLTGAFGKANATNFDPDGDAR
jgi:DNA-binding IclR family transcriptional regulator